MTTASQERTQNSLELAAEHDRMAALNRLRASSVALEAAELERRLAPAKSLSPTLKFEEQTGLWVASYGDLTGTGQTPEIALLRFCTRFVHGRADVAEEGSACGRAK